MANNGQKKPDEVCQPGMTQLRPSGTGGYYCEDCFRRVPHKFCRPKKNPSSNELRTTQWPLEPMAHGFPRRDINITPSEILDDHDKILGGPEYKYKISPPGPTVLQQPRLETSLYKQQETIDPSPYRVLEPLLEKLQHIYPRFDSETIFVAGEVDAPPAAAGPIPVPVTALMFDTVPGVVSYLRRIEVNVLDGLVPVNMGAGVFVDGEPVKYIAQTAAATSPPTYGVQPQTPNFPEASGMPIGLQNVLLIVPDRKRVEVRVANLDLVATRKVCVSIWGWLTPFVNFGR